jgi:hypothetical protein
MTTRTERVRATENRYKAMQHPLRATLLRIYSERTASPAELSRELLTDVSKISYHSRKLVELDCAELVDTRPVRGAVEHFYRGTERQLVATGDWNEITDPAKVHLLVEFMQPSVDDFEASLKADILGADEEWSVTRTRHVLDAQGYREALELHEELIRQMDRIREESANRSGEVVHVSSTVNCFRVPAL